MLKEQPKQKLHTKIIELKVYDMVLVFSFFKLTKNSVMFRLMYIFCQFKSPQFWRFSFKGYANQRRKN